jgi:CheY-like chemotaxis protein
MTNESGHRTILVIDDEPHVVDYLEMLLQDAGYETISAENGRVGLEKARSEKPDLICLDLNMPEESGVRFLRNAREDEEIAHIPILVITAVTGLGGQPEPLEKFLATRPHIRAPEGFFSKPIDREEFLAQVAEVLSPAG